MKYDKLIRDNIINILKNKNIDFKYHIANSNEYEEKLHAKLYEEIKELENTQSKQDRAEELADILEVLDAIIDHYDISIAVYKIKYEKQIKKGKFEKRIILDETD